MSDATPEPSAESLEVIRKFAETYAQRTGTYFCTDPSVTAVVLKGLARHKDELAELCVPAVITRTKKQRCQAFELSVFRCGNARNAIACGFSPRTTPSPAKKRPNDQH